MMREEIKSCPFCGEYASLYYDALDHHYFIRCSRCYCALKAGYRDENIAIKEWNTRATDQPPVNNKLETVNEEWRDVLGYEGLYKISSFGNIKSYHNKNNVKTMVQTVNRYGYLCVTLCAPNKKKMLFSIHKLVSSAFLGIRPKGLQVNHKDGNKLNNRSENLQYVTCKENIKHSLDNGLHPTGKKHGRWKHGKSAYYDNMMKVNSQSKPIKYPEKKEITDCYTCPGYGQGYNEAIDEFRRLNEIG